MSAVAAPLVAGAQRTGRRTLKRAVSVCLGSVLFGAIAGAAANGGHPADVIGLASIFLLVAVWRYPQLGPMIVLLTALVIEQFEPIVLGPTPVSIPITPSIPMFKGLGPVHLEPADLLPLVLFMLYMIRSSGTGKRWWPRSQLSLAVGALIVAVLFAEINGFAHHGDARWSLFECRPFIYFGAAYLLTSVTIRTRSAVQGMLWLIVAVEIIKSFQGIYVWSMTRSWTQKPETVLGHEAAVFFTLFFVVVAALWMFNLRGRLRTVATRAVPLVLFADIVNNRRAAWLILGAAFVVLVVIGYRVLPHRRRMLRRFTLVTLFVSAIYLPAYWNHTDGTLGAPADAVRSAFSPSPRDALSNEYRIDEDANLKFNIRQDGVLGAGFGRLIDYALPMPGLVTAGDAGIAYVPHNSVLYVLMTMGLFGATVFWAMLGAAIVAGCRLARCPDRLFGAVGAIVASMVVAWALEGATDMGFTFVRIAMVMGCLLGLLEASRHIHTASRASVVTASERSDPGPSMQKNPSRLVVG